MLNKTETTNDRIWLVMEFELNSGLNRAIAAYSEEINARQCAARMVGSNGKYYSLQQMVIEDV